MKDFNTVPQVAKMFGVNVVTVRKWIREGTLEAFQPSKRKLRDNNPVRGGKIYVTRRAIEKMIKDSKVT